jgi:hypothetical protein
MKLQERRFFLVAEQAGRRLRVTGSGPLPVRLQRPAAGQLAVRAESLGYYDGRSRSGQPGWFGPSVPGIRVGPKGDGSSERLAGGRGFDQ